MGAQGRHEVEGVEAFCEYLVEGEQGGTVVSLEKIVDERKAVLVVEDVEVADDILIVDVSTAEGDGLVEYREGVPHGAVGLGRDHVERLVVDGDPFLFRNHTEVLDGVADADPVEIVGLAAGKDGGEYLVLFGGGEYEYRVGRRLLKGLEEGIESRGTEHVDLVDDVDAVLAYGRRHLDFLHQGLDVVDAVVGGGIELMDAVGPAFVEGDAGLTFAAGLHVRPGVCAIDHLGEDPRRGRLADTAWAAEKISVGELSAGDGVFEGAGDIVLADERPEGLRPVLSC